MTPNSNLFCRLTLCVLLLLCVSLAHAQQPESILFVGNSYTAFNGMTSMVQQIAASKGDSIFVEHRVANAYSFKKHLADSMFYKSITERPYDRIVLQEWHVPSGNPAAFFETQSIDYAKSLVKIVRANQPCAQLYFSMPWASALGSSANGTTDYKQSNYAGLYERIASNFVTLQDSIPLPVSPIGAVWHRIVLEHPEIDLYDKEDKHHPNVCGSYLAACVNYIVLMKKSPVGAWKPDNLPNAVAQVLQTVAWQEMQAVGPFWSVDVDQSINSVVSHNISGGVLSLHCQKLEYDAVWWEIDGLLISNGLNASLPVANNCPIQVSLFVVRGCDTLQFEKTIKPIGIEPKLDAIMTKPTCPLYQNGQISALVQGLQAPISYAWSNGGTQQHLADLTEGAYAVTVTSSDGCTLKKVFTLREADKFEVALATVSACSGACNGKIEGTILGDNSGSYNWQWSNGETNTTGQLSGLTPSNYGATVTNASGCSANRAVSIQNVNNVSGQTSLNFSNIKPNSITVKWKPNPCIEQQRIDWVVVGQTSLQSLTLGATQDSVVLTGLIPFKRYIIRVNSLVGGTLYLGTNNFTTTQDTFYYDGDLDGFGVAAEMVVTNDSFANLVHLAGDCDDGDALTYPFANEFCDGLDNDCDNVIDESPLECITMKKPIVTLATNTSFTIRWDVVNCMTGYQVKYKSASNNIWFTSSFGPADSSATFNNPNGTGGLVQISILGFCNLNMNNDWSLITTFNCSENQYPISPELSGTLPCDNPSVIETCNGLDDNCNGLIDEGIAGLSYADADNDGFGNPNLSKTGCFGIGYVANNFDCNDTQSAIKPNATEICNGVDDDCDGQTDEGLPSQLFYVDVDLDGFGSTTSVQRCAVSPGYATNNTDCNDNDASAFAALPIVSASANVLCPGANIVLQVSNASSQSCFLWSNGASASNIQVDAAGTYSVSVTSACGVQSTSFTVTANEFPETPVLQTSNTLLCVTGSATISVANVNDATSYTWSNGSASASITVAAPGAYTVTATNVCGTKKASQGIINGALPASPLLSASSSSICLGESATISVTNINSGNTYVWSNGVVGTSITVLSAGTYTVTATNSCGTKTKTKTIGGSTTPALPSISLSSPGLCPGAFLVGSITNANSNNTYQWSNGSNGISAQIATAGTYTVTVTNTCGAATSTVSVLALSLPETPQFTNSDSISCPGNPITISISNPTIGNSFAWSNGAVGTSINTNITSTYTVSVTNACGVQTASISVQSSGFPALPQLSASAISLCPNQISTLSVTNVNPVNSYLWSNGSTDTEIQVNTAGTYTVTVTNYCGSKTKSISILGATLPAIPQLSVSNIALCPGDSSLLQVTNVNPNNTYLWSNGNTGASINVNEPGTYLVSITNACGTIADSIEIIAKELPQTPLVNANNPTLCPNQSTVLNIINASPALSYAWSNGALGTATTINSAATYTVSATNICGTMTSDITINSQSNPALPNLLVSNTVICPDSVATISVVNVNEQNTYVWSTGSTETNILVTSAGSYTVSATNFCGTRTKSVSLSSGGLPILPSLITDNPAICPNETATINVSNNQTNVNYLWSNGSNSPEILVNVAGIYTVSVSNFCGSVSESIAIAASTLPDIPAFSVSDTVLCFGETAGLSIINGNPDWTYAWSTGQTASSIDIDQAASISLIATNQCGQVVSPASIIQQSALLPPIISAMEPCSLSVFSANAASYNWYLNEIMLASGTNSIEAVEPGLYQVVATDILGCQMSSDEWLQALCTNSTTDFGLENLQLFPNPTQHVCYFSRPLPQNAQVIVHNALGQTLSIYQHANEIDFSFVPSGVYFIAVSDVSLQYKVFRVVKL